MRQGTRVVCLFLPFVFLLASLICLLFVFFGNQTSAGPFFSHKFYFIKFDTSSLKVRGHTISSFVSGLQDWYTISLWNYCSGSSSSDTPTFCSKPTFAYYFDPSQVWSLANVAIATFSDVDWDNALATYRAVAKFTFIAYIIAIIATAITLVFSVFAFCSRIGSIFTTLACTISIIFTIVASATASAMYLVLAGVVKAQLGKYGLTASLGGTMLAVAWLAAAFSIAGAGWYLFSSCCCGVDNTHKALRGEKGWKKGHYNRNSRVALIPGDDEVEKGYHRVDRSPSPNPYARGYLSGVGYQQTSYAPVQGEYAHDPHHQHQGQETGYLTHDNNGYGGAPPAVGLTAATPPHHQPAFEPYRNL